MKFIETPLRDLFIVESQIFNDKRGSFQRIHCNFEFAKLGFDETFTQMNLSTNENANTLRGLHYQNSPHQEDKLVRCVHGAILDVVIDLRTGSPTRGQHYMIEMSSENAIALLVPKGFAHGYLTLTDGAVILYKVSTPYMPCSEGGVRWNDPQFAIPWPVKDPIISAKDAGWPDYTDIAS